MKKKESSVTEENFDSFMAQASEQDLLGVGNTSEDKPSEQIAASEVTLIFILIRYQSDDGIISAEIYVLCQSIVLSVILEGNPSFLDFYRRNVVLTLNSYKMILAII
jgi:hypothetical protein